MTRKPTTSPKLKNAQIERLNRCAVDPLLMNLGYAIYEPVIDYDGVDIILLKQDLQTVLVQFKSRISVHKKYKEKGIQMLFPGGNGSKGPRSWFMVPHDKLYEMFAKGIEGVTPHGDTVAMSIQGHWHEKNVSVAMSIALDQYIIGTTP